jgi:hypothetical protein
VAFETSQGITFKFNNVVYTATAISVTKSMGEFNVTSTDIPVGANCRTRYRAGGLKSTELKVDWVGNTLPPTDELYAIDLDGAGPGSGAGLTGDDLGVSPIRALCTGLTITAQAGELIKGSCTFKISVD